MGVLYLISPFGKDVKSKAVAIINPSSAERQELKKANKSLDSITKAINGPAGTNLRTSDRLAIKNMVHEAQSSIAKVEEQIDDSDLMASVNSLISKVVRRDNPNQTTCNP